MAVDAQAQSERAEEEGASPGLVRVVRRVEQRAPALAGPVGFGVAVYGRFARQRGSVLAGGLAFFALLSLVPSFLSLGALVALLVDPATFVADLRDVLVEYPELLSTVDPLLQQIGSLGSTSLTALGVTGLISLGVSLYAASRVVYIGRQVLDVAFEVEPRAPSLISRILSIAVTLVAQLLVVVAIVVLSVVPRILDALGVGDAYASSIRILRLPLAALLVYLFLTFSMRFGIRPRRSVAWVNLGGALGTVIMVVGTLGLSWYLTVSTTYSQVIAVLGGVIALEIWLYLVGLAIVLSAQTEGVRNGFRRRDAAVPGPAPEHDAPGRRPAGGGPPEPARPARDAVATGPDA